MDELLKIVRVLKKIDPDAPHETLLVLDATVGRNALAQEQIFGRTAYVSGLVMTKLDGTARGGVLVPVAQASDAPIKLIGVGEGVDDLQPFDARAFSRSWWDLRTDDDRDSGNGTEAPAMDPPGGRFRRAGRLRRRLFHHPRPDQGDLGAGRSPRRSPWPSAMWWSGASPPCP